MIKACGNIKAEIFVVDNNSTDGSKEFFTERFPQVTFIWNDINVGFAKANNAALKQATGEKVLFLNPDTIVPEDCFKKCLQYFNQQNNIGALGVQMIDGAGNFLPESKRGFPSPWASVCRMTGLTNLFPHSKLLSRYYLGHLPENKSHEVDVLSGAFMMVDKKVLDHVGSFDEAYFMYAEDIDLSYRIQKAGYKNFYFSGTTIIHFKGESVSRQSKSYIQNFYGTMIQFTRKHYTGLTQWSYVLLLNFFIFFKSRSVINKKLPPGPQANTIFTSNKKLPATTLALINKYFAQVQIIDKPGEAVPGSTLLLSEPYITFSQVISVMQAYKNKYQFYIHSTNAAALIASGDKSRQGVAQPL